MGKKLIDRIKVKKMSDSGQGVTQIAKKLGCSKGTVSKILKEMGLMAAIHHSATTKAAPKYSDGIISEAEALFELFLKQSDRLEWISKNIPEGRDLESKEWLQHELATMAEARKTLTASVDVKYKLFKGIKLVEALGIIDEEIGKEDVGLQRRIRDRFKNRFGVTYPHQ